MTEIEELQRSLDEVRGGYARFGAYAGLRMLTLDISSGDDAFMVNCMECQYIAAPTFWGPVNFSCSRFGVEELVLEDDAAGVRIICHLIAVVQVEE